MGRLEYLVGQKFERLTVIAEAETHIKPCGDKVPMLLCKCECGNKKKISFYNLKSGNTKSCGCYSREIIKKRKMTHGMFNTRIYRIYAGMKSRCYNPNRKKYPIYGGRGIKICDEWLGEDGFMNFYNWSISNGYDDTLSIDRIDVNGNYEPSNCRWATTKKQGNNTTTNRYITFNGKTKTLAEWSDETGISYSALKHRIDRGWEIEKALTTKGNCNYRKLTYNGETHSYEEWSKITGIPLQTLKNRGASGWNEEDILTTPYGKKRINDRKGTV